MICLERTILLEELLYLSYYAYSHWDDLEKFRNGEKDFDIIVEGEHVGSFSHPSGNSTTFDALRDMIVERTQEGREIARQNPNHRDGRKKKYTPQQMEHALAMLKKNSYNQGAAMTGISKSTLIRANKEKIK